MSNLKLLDGSVINVRTERDFSDLLEAKLGTDVRDWFTGYTANLEAEELNKLRMEVLDIVNDISQDVDELKSLVEED